jgi:hypothetical protein
MVTVSNSGCHIEAPYTECRYAECCYAESRGTAKKLDRWSLPGINLVQLFTNFSYCNETV